MRVWTTKEIMALRGALRRGLSLDAIAQLLPRHSARGIIAQARKERIDKSLPLQNELREFLTDKPQSGKIESAFSTDR
jgi:hypothetical protein